MPRPPRLREAAFGYQPAPAPEPREGTPVQFLTLRLAGSLPAAWNRQRPPVAADPEDRLRQIMARFREEERLLDAGLGPDWLADPAVASMVCGCLHHGDGQLYRLHRYVVLPNHLHALIEPLALDGDRRLLPSPAAIVRRLEAVTARRGNQLLDRRGPFWDGGWFEHDVRDPAWYRRFTDYIDSNPVLAGLSATPGEWPWGSAGELAA